MATEKKRTEAEDIETMGDIIVDAAQEEPEEAANTVDSYTYTFPEGKGFEFEGKTYDKLSFDWSRLTGKDSLQIQRDLQRKGIAVVAPELSPDFLTRAAVRACTDKIDADLLLALPVRAYNKICLRARSFLMQSAQ